MLGQRVITALLLLAVFLPALFHPDPRWLAGLSLILITLAGWEWGRLIGCAARGAVWLGLLCLLVCLLTWAIDRPGTVRPWLWLAVSLLWTVGGSVMLRRGLSNWVLLPMVVRATLGVGVLWATWLALFDAKRIGTNFMLSVLLLVWAADIAAYFAGRAFGRRKLAPAISPGKTWEGVAGALLGVTALALVWLQIDARLQPGSDSIYSALLAQGWLVFALGLVLLTAVSVLGDLLESLLKRCAGVKDSSQLLPGHGGILDRIDALLPTFPLALCLISWVRP